MARYQARRTTRSRGRSSRSYAPARRTYGRRSSGSGRRRVSSGRGGQRLRIEVVAVGANPVARPLDGVLQRQAAAPRRSMF